MQACIAMDSSTCDAARQLLATAFVATRVGEPDAGNLHVRFDEGERPRGRSLLDYRRAWCAEGAVITMHCGGEPR